MLMSFSLPDSRTLLRLALASIALTLGLGQAAVASEVTTPVEQLHAGLMAIMKAGKTAPFRQRYDMIAPVIGQTFDLEVILRIQSPPAQSQERTVGHASNALFGSSHEQAPSRSAMRYSSRLRGHVFQPLGELRANALEPHQ